MREQKADQLVEAIENHVTEPANSNFDVIERERRIWNFQRNEEDSDVELKLGYSVDIAEVMAVVKRLECWTIRWAHTAEPGSDYGASVALIYHPPEPTPSGVALFDSLWDK